MVNALAAYAPPPLGSGGLTVVTIVRCSPLALDDDNATGAAKTIRDQVAEWLGLANDRDPRVEWRVEQATASRGAESIVIRIRSGARP